MEAKDVVIVGIEDVIKRDLVKHRGYLDQAQTELLAYKQARVVEVDKKKHYRKQIGGGKYNDDSLRKAMSNIAINIRHMDDKIKLTDDRIEHETLIVDTLAGQLAEQEKSLERLAEYRRQHGT